MGIVRAADFDLSKYSEDTVFVLDTNILYFVHSGYYLPTDAKCICYSNLIQDIISNGRKVTVSALNLQELLFGIENKEYFRFLNSKGISRSSFSKKDYRKDLSERQSLKTKLKTVITEITNSYALMDGQISGEQVKSFADNLESHRYDPIDYILVDTMLVEGNVVFISDDTDFQFDSRIDLITA